MKKLISFIVAITLLTALMSGCGRTAGTDLEKISGFDVALRRQYDFAGEFNEGFAKVGNLDGEGNMKYFFIDTEGQAISAEYDYADDFSDGMAVVGNKKNFGPYSDGYVYGYIDTTGKEAIPLQFDAPASDDMCYAFYEGLAVVQKMDSDVYSIETYLIDKQGNKVTETEVFEPGYGGYGMEDPRVLDLEAVYDKYDKYIGWSDIQYARVFDKFPVKTYVTESKSTVELNEKLETVSTIPGKVINGWNDIIFVDYDFMNSWDEKVLRYTDGTVIKSDVSHAYEMKDGVLNVTTNDDMTHLYTTDGNVIAENLFSAKAWTEGYFLEKTQGEFTVTDKDFNLLWTVQGTDIYQSSSHGYYEGNKFVQVYEPLFCLGVQQENEWGNMMTVYDYINPENGQVVIPYQEKVSVNNLSDEFYCIKPFGADGTQTPAVLFNVKTNAYITLEGIYDVIHQRTDGGGSVVSYSIEPGQSGERIYAYLVADGSGFPIFDDIDTTGENGTAYDAYALAKNDVSSIWGVEGEQVPVTLKKGEDVFGQFNATSLIYKNIRKDGNVDWDNWTSTDIAIVNLEGEALTATYKDMGRISGGYISFLENGKWGYLKAK